MRRSMMVMLAAGGEFSWSEPAPAMGQRVTVVIDDEVSGPTEEHTLHVGQPDTTAPRLTPPVVTISEDPNGALLETLSRNRAVGGSVSATRAITGVPALLPLGLRRRRPR